MELFRAANNSYTNSDTTAFATARNAAKAYLDNPNFGGSTLYAIQADIDDSAVLDATGEIPSWLVAVLPEAYECLGSAIGGFVGGKAREALEARGFKWVRLVDSYPADTITMLLIGSDDTIEDLLSEAE